MSTKTERKESLVKGDKRIQQAMNKIADLATAFKTTGNEYMYEEMMHIGGLIKEGRKEYARSLDE